MHSSRMRTVRNSSRLLGWGCLLLGWVSATGGCLLPGGCLFQGGACSGGVCSWAGGGGDIPACTEADPICGQTDRCKNITFATSLRTVTINRFIFRTYLFSTSNALRSMRSHSPDTEKILHCAIKFKANVEE